MHLFDLISVPSKGQVWTEVRTYIAVRCDQGWYREVKYMVNNMLPFFSVVNTGPQ